jgi:DNA-binding beta-propeller fold protein YncE
MRRREFLAAASAALVRPARTLAGTRRHLLYVATPGIRNYTSYGGVGVIVFDIVHGHRFVKRIPTWPVAAGQEPENVKGVAASARTRRLYVSTYRRLACLDLLTEQLLWDKALEGGCDRMAISPDGRTLYVPSFEGPHWNVVNAATGEVVTKIVTNAGAHNTVFALDGSRVYLAGLRSPILSVADASTHTVVKTIGPFSAPIRPFTVNAAQTRVYVNVNELLGFEIGDLQTGKPLHRVEVQGYKPGPVKLHGCPSHGIALTPDESEVWLSDGHNNVVHVFDNTVMPPRQKTTISVREQPGWITFGIDGRLAYPSTGEVFETRTKRKVAALQDETGRQVSSEKLLEIVFEGATPIRAGDQFGIGRKEPVARLLSANK